VLAYHEPGDPAGSTSLLTAGFTPSQFWVQRYPAHRVVYYMRTGVDPGDADVLHGKDNIARDNRLELTLYQRRTRPAPRYRRRVRDEERRPCLQGSRRQLLASFPQNPTAETRTMADILNSHQQLHQVSQVN
jgi:hypothetical protein